MKRGDIVAIAFLDHVEDASKPMKFDVFGRVVRLSNRSVSVACWAHAGSMKVDHNVKRFTIVRSCILRVDILREK